MRKATILGLVVMATLAVGCGRRGVPLRTTTAGAIGGRHAPGDVRAALFRALEADQFVVEQEAQNQLVARYTRGRITLRVGIAYNPAGYQIQYLDSAGLRHSVDRGGAAWIHPRYDRMITHLQRQIDEEIARPLREAREHQIRLAEAAPDVVVAPTVAPVVVQQPQYAQPQPQFQQPQLQQPQYAQPHQAQVSVGAGVVGPDVAHPSAQPSCEAALADIGHPASAEIFCDGAEPTCAQELLYQGHEPNELIFCRDAEPSCAMAHLRGGGMPVGLSACR
ncbi:MAG: hypothetical protein VYE22_05815 [Myxococcota bacterium]|nr:hypothetical protein [Myxococcota bacterium]